MATFEADKGVKKPGRSKVFQPQILLLGIQSKEEVETPANAGKTTQTPSLILEVRHGPAVKRLATCSSVSCSV